MAKVMVIDDDPALLKALRLGLRAGGHEVITAGNGEQGLIQTAAATPDVVVLDLGLPDIDGLEVCRRIREWSAVPILVLSAVDDEARKVAALDIGADDYITKPFGMAELQARIRAALRRRAASGGIGSGAGLGVGTGTGGSSEVSAGSVRVDLLHHQAELNGQPLDLTAKELDVLTFLVRHGGRTCTHEMILNAVWGPGYGREARYLHAYIHRLRQKLHDAGGTLIRTVPGIGYVFQAGA